MKNYLTKPITEDKIKSGTGTLDGARELTKSISDVYTRLENDAKNRNLKLSSDDTLKTQRLLNTAGYTDLQGKKLKEDAILGDKTKVAAEKYFQSGIPKADIMNMQKQLNKNGITDRLGKALIVDGKLGPKTDGAVHEHLGKKRYTKEKDNNPMVKLPYYPGETKHEISEPVWRGKPEDIEVNLLSGKNTPTEKSATEVPSFMKEQDDSVLKEVQGSKDRAGLKNAIAEDYDVFEDFPEKEKFKVSDEKKATADKVIRDNAQYIKDAAEEFGVNPAILAACIYGEQCINYNITDKMFDHLWFRDPSVGVAQVLISTAIGVEDAGYIKPKTEAYETQGNGKTVSRQEAIAEKLKEPETCIRYAAAYLQQIQDAWKSEYPEIDGRTGILATLYNIGIKNPHSNPYPNAFGIFAYDNYYHMQDLLGIK